MQKMLPEVAWVEVLVLEVAWAEVLEEAWLNNSREQKAIKSLNI